MRAMRFTARNALPTIRTGFARSALTPASSPLANHLRGFRTTTAKWNAASKGAGAEKLNKTGLYDFHVKNGAKMVPFAGYDMPLGYDGVGYGESVVSIY